MTDGDVAALELSGLKRVFRTARGEVPVLSGVDLTVEVGQVVGLTGPSGSGKTTLLQLAGLLERPDRGSVKISGCDYARASERSRTRARRVGLGFVYQFHHLLPELSALENVSVPLRVVGTGLRAAVERARYLLDMVGMADRMEHRPGQLSGGERQRVAIARAMANRPRVLLADEPTGNLDPDRSLSVFSLLLNAARSEGAAILVATHDLSLCEHMDAVYRLRSGQVVRVQDDRAS